MQVAEIHSCICMKDIAKTLLMKLFNFRRKFKSEQKQIIIMMTHSLFPCSVSDGFFMFFNFYISSGNIVILAFSF